MDLNDYWQENKRFVSTVAGGALVFLVAYLVIGNRYEDRIGAQRSQRLRLEGEMRDAHFTAADFDEAEAENEALQRAVARLAADAEFVPREPFRIERSSSVSPGSQYLRAMNDVSAALIPRAKRANMRIPEDLGMPALSPTRDDDIERYLAALDVIDTVAGLAIDSKVERIERINVRLDPGLGLRQGVGRVERTEVQFTLEGAAKPLSELLARTQRPPDGRPLCLGDVELSSSRFKAGDGSLEMTVVAVRLHEPTDEEEGR